MKGIGYLFERREITTVRLIVYLVAFLMVFANWRFFGNVLDAYPVSLRNTPFLLSLVWVFGAVMVIPLSLVCWGRATKPLTMTLVFAASVTAYFMDTYNTIIDESMMLNVVRTDPEEVFDLLSGRLALYVVFLGILPALVIGRAKIVRRTAWLELSARAKLLGLTIISVLVVVFPLSDYYSSFLRENPRLRYYSNPGCIVYGTSKLVASLVRSETIAFTQVGLDARIVDRDGPRRLVIFVVGESARADRFSLNGYERETNPLLRLKPVVSFTDFWSYGTSTAISVPYMFSAIDASDFDLDAAAATENVLDIMLRVGTHVLWLDNNSSSKGVAERVPYKNYKERHRNPVCDVECRDEGMLRRLQKWIDKRPEGDVFIVLHAMGNHGPAYYKRYPADFEKFTPVARTNQLQDCSDEEIGNAYDNAILYTDYFLAKTIEFLEGNDDDFDVAMLYISDHGESLGENGIYLHGLPDFIAPDAQRHVPAVFWMGDGFGDVDMAMLEARRDREYSHEHISHSLLGLMGIETSVYDSQLDLFRGPD